MDDPLIFDTLHASEGVRAAASHNGAHLNYDHVVQRWSPGEEPREVVVRAYMLASEIGMAQTPVGEYMARYIERAGGPLNDGRRLERLLELVEPGGGSLHVPPPADVQDWGQSLPPRAKLPAGFF